MRDARLDLGRYITNPFNKRGDITKRLDFDDLFTSKAAMGDYPFNPSRFETKDLLKRAMTKKLTQNPGLNFTPNTPFFDDNKAVTSDYELFEGLGRFNRKEDYSFDDGRPLTRQKPQDQPDFNPMWMDAYNISPTLNPSKESDNPMPRMKNPDPNGYLMAKAENRVERELEGKKSVAEILEENISPSKKKQVQEERQGEQTEKIEKESS
jgi:hypothetical protein